MARYLISGMESLVSDVTKALREEGADAVGVVDIADVPRACSEAGPGAFDGYIQLPANFTVQGDTAVDRVGHFFTDGVMARFPAVAAALPTLVPKARITFVMGVLPPEVSTEHDVAARAALVRVLAHAARADAPAGLRIATLDAHTAPARIAAVAMGRPIGPDTNVGELPEESFTEWRMQLLSMVWAET